MNFLTRARTNILSWTHATPLPSLDEAYPIFQSWHLFDSVQHWTPTCSTNTKPLKKNWDTSNLSILSWNIDATSPRTEERVTEIIAFITRLDPHVDVIFFQEVSKPALQQILKDDHIRGYWLISERDDTAWDKQSFTTMTLLSKARFMDSDSGIITGALGPIWRVKYPSHFNRDAICCDIFIPSPKMLEPASTIRIRLINVHLDSLPINPSRRPQQISILSSFLRAAGCGLIAGDFNPVLEEDAMLVENNGLSDAWTTLYPDEPGYTWGVNGEQPFPPNRLDKFAVLGIIPHEIKALEPKILTNLDGSKSQQTEPVEDLPWSDHHALLCSIDLSTLSLPDC